MATHQQYRQGLAQSRDMGGFIAFLATSASADAGHVIASSLIDSTPNISPRYGGQWLYGGRHRHAEHFCGVWRDRDADRHKGRVDGIGWQHWPVSIRGAYELYADFAAQAADRLVRLWIGADTVDRRDVQRQI